MRYKKNYEQQKKTIEELVVKVYQSIETKMGANQMRLVSWVLDGKKLDAQFEKRAFVMREYKGVVQKQMGKAKGLTKADLDYMTNEIGWDTVRRDMVEFAKQRDAEIVATAKNDEFDIDDEEKIAEEMFS